MAGNQEQLVHIRKVEYVSVCETVEGRSWEITRSECPEERKKLIKV